MDRLPWPHYSGAVVYDFVYGSKVALGSISDGALAGCGAGRNAATLKPYTPTDGVQGTAQSINVRDVVLISLPDGTGVLVATAVQTGSLQDRITGIAVNGKPASLAPACGPTRG